MRLSDFEFYMLTDDRPTHPMVFVMVVIMRGRLDEQAFRSSLNELLRFHPLLGCRIQQLPQLGWSWVPLNDPSILNRCVSWKNVDDAQVVAFTPSVRVLNIQDDAGFFIEAVVGPETSQVVLHLHHCCCDGIGGLQLVGELFARYGQQTAEPGAKRPEIDAIDPTKLFAEGKLRRRRGCDESTEEVSLEDHRQDFPADVSISRGTGCKESRCKQ